MYNYFQRAAHHHRLHLLWDGQVSVRIFLHIMCYHTFSLDPNRKPPPPLTSPTRPSPKQQPMTAPTFNPSDVLNRGALRRTKPPSEPLPPPPPPPSEPEWAPREYLEKGEHDF